MIFIQIKEFLLGFKRILGHHIKGKCGKDVEIDMEIETLNAVEYRKSFRTFLHTVLNEIHYQHYYGRGGDNMKDTKV